METIPKPPPEKKSPRYLIAVLGIIVIFIGIYLFSPLSDTGKNREHIIAGVPYWGVYKGSEFHNPLAFGAYSILQYWGDTRFSALGIGTEFPLVTADKNIDISSGLALFFQNNGYAVEFLTAQDPSDLYEYIEKDIPLILSYELPGSYRSLPRLKNIKIVIGYSEKDQILWIHDNIRGNNFPLSVNNFEAGSFFVAVQPTESIRTFLKEPEIAAPYPERLAVMDSESIQRIMFHSYAISYLIQLHAERNLRTGPQIVELAEEIVAEEDFEKLHPADRLLFSYTLAQAYIDGLGEVEARYDDAATILTSITLPLINTNLSLTKFGEWERVENPKRYSQGSWWHTRPWTLLGRAELGRGNTSAAQEAFEKALAQNPNDEEALMWIQRL